jgi:hypothetical protein
VSFKKSITDDLIPEIEAAGIGSMGVDLFSVEPPDDQDVRFFTLLRQSPVGGAVHRVLSGNESMETSFLVVQVVSTTEEDGLDTANKVKETLEALRRYLIEDTQYMSILAVTPVRLIGCDSQRRYVHEVVFQVNRKQ